MDLIQSLPGWVTKAEDRRTTEFSEYVVSIAEARYVMRKVSRIVDDEAKLEGLDPLEHQVVRKIDRKVHVHMDYFQTQLTEPQRLAALAIFSFYLSFASPAPELASSFGQFGDARQ